MQDYPEGVAGPAARLTMDGYGVEVQARKPPYTSLTAYDLNKGTIRWQISTWGDYRVVKEAGIHGTGAAETLKSSAIVTSPDISSGEYKSSVRIPYVSNTPIQLYNFNPSPELRRTSLLQLTQLHNRYHQVDLLPRPSFSALQRLTLLT